MTDGINQGRGTLGRLMNDPAAAKSLEASLENLEAVTARIRAGEGSLGKLLNDDALSTVADVDDREPGCHHRPHQQRRRHRGQAGDRSRAVQPAQLDVRPLDKVDGGAAEGEGTAGQLLQDKQLYENMNGTMVELRSLDRRHQEGSEEVSERQSQFVLT